MRWNDRRQRRGIQSVLHDLDGRASIEDDGLALTRQACPMKVTDITAQRDRDDEPYYTFEVRQQTILQRLVAES